MATAFRSFQSTRLLLVLVVLAVLAVVLVLATPHILTFVSTLSHGSLMSPHPMICNNVPGPCN